MWQKLKLEKPNVISKMISKSSVATMVETHFEIDISIIKVDNKNCNYPSTSWEEHCWKMF
jgi:hypothetical protein